MSSNDDAAGGVALARCIARSAASFAEHNWSRTPLLSRAGDLGATFDDLLDASAVDELVSRRGLRTPFLRMAKDGTVLPAGRFTRGGGAGAGIGDLAADDRVLAMIGDGATLVLQALHRTWPPLVDFAAHLSDELGHPVQINAYVTPAASRGFAAHYDVHDVFVLQVAGRKHWSIHAPVVTDPLDNDPWKQHRDAVAARAKDDEPLIDCVLEPGDALYLPRGTIHAAEALGEISIHLTVGVHPITRFQLVQQLLDLAQQQPALRTSLPMGADLADPAVLAPHLAATVEELREFLVSAPAEEIARRVGNRLMGQTRPEPLGPLAQLVAAESVGRDTRLRLRTGLRYRLELLDEHVSLVLLERTVTVPILATEAVKIVLTGEVFCPAELCGLDEDEQLVLARRLLREGVIVPA